MQRFSWINEDTNLRQSPLALPQLARFVLQQRGRSLSTQLQINEAWNHVTQRRIGQWGRFKPNPGTQDIWKKRKNIAKIKQLLRQWPKIPIQAQTTTRPNKLEARQNRLKMCQFRIRICQFRLKVCQFRPKIRQIRLKVCQFRPKIRQIRLETLSVTRPKTHPKSTRKANILNFGQLRKTEGWDL